MFGAFVVGGSMVFDTDVVIWVLRGHAGAAAAIDRAETREISVVSYMELLQGARDKREARLIKRFLNDTDFRTLPLSENIGHRAMIYIEEYGRRVEIGVADALIAATAVEQDSELLSGNAKHFRPIEELQLRTFRK